MIAFPASLPSATAEDERNSLPPPASPAELEELGDEIARLAAHLHAATYRLLVLIRRFDEGGGWGGGFRSCAQWLSWRTGIGPGPAREKVRVARALATLPRISEAMARGELSFSKVRALTRVATPANEKALLEVARHATAAHIERIVRAWRRVDRLEEAEVREARHAQRFLRLDPDDDGSWVLRGRLDPEVGALVERALAWAMEALYRQAASEAPPAAPSVSGPAPPPASSAMPAPPPSPSSEATAGQRRADALGLLAERALVAPASPSGRADRFQVVVHMEAAPMDDLENVSAETSCTPELSCTAEAIGNVGAAGGAGPSGKARMPGNETCPGKDEENVSAETPGADPGSRSLRPSLPSLRWPAHGIYATDTSRRLACDADVVVMTHHRNRGVLDVGRKHRTVTPALRRALEARDDGCRFPGCGCRFTDAHHVVHWTDGGETKLDNLILLCRRHHRAVHEEGVRVEVGADPPGSVRFYRPDGRWIPEVPPAPQLPARPVRALVQAQEEEGIAPDPWTATPLWYGEPLDLRLAIDMLRPLGSAPPDGSG